MLNFGISLKSQYRRHGVDHYNCAKKRLGRSIRGIGKIIGQHMGSCHSTLHDPGHLNLGGVQCIAILVNHRGTGVRVCTTLLVGDDRLTNQGYHRCGRIKDTYIPLC